MARKNHRLSIIAQLTVGLMALFAACNAEDDMQLSYQHTAQVGLYSTKTHNDTALTNVQVYGIGREDSLLYDVASTGSLFLNMNMNEDVTEYVIRTQTLEDRLTFHYRKRLSPVSGSAGIAMEISIDSIGHTRTFIDSLSIVKRDINYNESLENVRLYIY